MNKILFLAPVGEDGQLGKAGLEALAGAKALADGAGVALVAGLIGREVQAAADQVAGTGFEKILAAQGEPFAQARYVSDAAAVAALVQASGAEIVVASGGSRMNRCLPGAARRLGGAADLHVTRIEEGPTACRWYYRQRMEARQTRTARPWILALDPGALKPWQGEAGSATIEPVNVELPEPRTQVEGTVAPAGDEQTIRPDAELLFVAGAGWTKKQADGAPHVGKAGELILGFLGKSKASLGSSKSLVDLSGEGQEVLSFMSHLNQVGQTGATPRHPKGLATCCHGEEPHVVGWRFIGERRAVNLDPNCGWGQGKADVLYVADAFEVVEKLNERLSG